jgi:hypothetical protein
MSSDRKENAMGCNSGNAHTPRVTNITKHIGDNQKNIEGQMMSEYKRTSYDIDIQCNANTQQRWQIVIFP